MARSILFVCLGNICRSPMADAIARHATQGMGFTIDSAGTGAWHAGEAADPRTLEVLERHGIAYDGRARQVVPEDFERFDLILAMDRENVVNLLRQCPPGHRKKLHLVLEPLGDGLEVGDPYYGGPEGFDRAYAQLTEAISYWIAS